MIYIGYLLFSMGIFAKLIPLILLIFVCLIGWYYALLMADILPYVLFVTDVKSLFKHDRCCFGVDWCYVCCGIGLMLCPLADVITKLSDHRRFRVWCYYPCLIMADGYCHVADGIATGWTILFWLADIIVMWQMLFPVLV